MSFLQFFDIFACFIIFVAKFACALSLDGFVKFDRFYSQSNINRANYDTFKIELNAEKNYANFPVEYTEINLPGASQSLKVPLSDKLSNFLLFHLNDDEVEQLPENYVVSLVVNQDIYPQQRVRLLDIPRERTYPSYTLGDIVAGAMKESSSNFDSDSRVWNSKVTLQHLLYRRLAGYYIRDK